MNFLCLGPFMARCGELEVNLHNCRRARLLAALVVRAGETVSVSRLAEELWGADPPRSKRNALQVHIHRLRQDLRRWGDTTEVAARYPGYVLHTGPDSVDFVRFQKNLRLAQQLAATDPTRSGTMARRALATWRGDAFEGMDLGGIAASARVRLSEARLLATDVAITADLKSGLDQRLLPELLELVLLHPYHERFHQHLMLVLYRSGRQVEALEVYRTVQQRLATELGVRPSPMFTRRMTEILRHDPVLRSGAGLS